MTAQNTKPLFDPRGSRVLNLTSSAKHAFVNSDYSLKSYRGVLGQPMHAGNAWKAVGKSGFRSVVYRIQVNCECRDAIGLLRLDYNRKILTSIIYQDVRVSGRPTRYPVSSCFHAS